MSGDGSEVLAIYGGPAGPTVTVYRNPALERAERSLILPVDVGVRHAADLAEVPELFRDATAFAKTFAAQRRRDAVTLVGPMAGSTWATYRAPETQHEAQFPGDVAGLADFPATLARCGLRRAHAYYSYAASTATLAAALSQNFSVEPRPGLRLEPVTAVEFPDALRELYPVVAAAFAANVLATPMTEAGFLAAYAPLAAVAEDGWLRRGYLGEQLVGLALLPRGPGQGGTSVIKTLARLPGRELSARGIAARGLGAELTQLAAQVVIDRGDARCVMALMHEANPSLQLARALGGREIKRYGLYTMTVAASGTRSQAHAS